MPCTAGAGAFKLWQRTPSQAAGEKDEMLVGDTTALALRLGLLMVVTEHGCSLDGDVSKVRKNVLRQQAYMAGQGRGGKGSQ
jgi:hypothetical protein